MPLAVASRYARALADLVSSPSSSLGPQQAIEQLRAFEGLLAESHELRGVLLSPSVPPARKRLVISRLGQMLEISDVVKRFLFVIVDHRRTAILDEIRAALEVVLDERLGIARASIASARQMTDVQQEALSAEFSVLTGKQVRCTFTIEEDLVGGAMARIGSTIYDGSVRGQLEALRQRLVSGS